MNTRGLKRNRKLAGISAALGLAAALASPLHAQPYSINWYKVSGGGGTSTNAQYALSGTIGQHDAVGPMIGGGYSVTGGFWAVIQTPGLPALSIQLLGPNSVMVSWPDTAVYPLQTNGNPVTPNWVNFGGPVSKVAGTNSVTITPATGYLYFRLGKP